ncbi:hypothetical protein [Bradyrhizobium cenepequi]
MAFAPPPTDQECLDAFHAKQNHPTISGAAASIGVTVSQVKHRANLCVERGLDTGQAKAPDAPKGAPVDVVERHRLSSEIARLKALCQNLTERLSAAEEHRSSILGLPVSPAEPSPHPKSKRSSKKHSAQAVVLHLSDLHVGEVVNREEVMGVNEYSLDVAEKRIGRLFSAASVLMTSAWPASDDAPAKVCVLLGGDLISGHGLHPEHAETDAGTAYQQTKWAAEYISAGVLRLHLDLVERFGRPVPIEMISVVGNHGRDTFGKPRTKLVSIQSYDTLVSDFVEAALKQYKTITHYRPRGFDAYFDVVGWPCLLTHGDRMGSGGGTGFIGPMASIVKGHRKIIDTEHRQRRPVYRVFSGHFHTTGVTSFGFSNGSGVSYGEFAKSIRADPEPAQQNLVVFHERLGVIRWHPIAMGAPEEGSLYQPGGGLVMPDLSGSRA